MDKTELNKLVEQLETQHDMTVADFDGVAQALGYILPKVVPKAGNLAQHLNETDDAMHIADKAFPDWSVHIRGRTNDRDGHWTCTLRENDSRDADAYIGIGKSPVLSQAVLAAVFRLAMQRAGPEEAD